MIKQIAITTIALGLSALNSLSSIYTNDMDYVLGDVKQIIITNQLNTNAQCDNLLDGFEEMEVNGIRIPIFANDGLVPNNQYSITFTIEL